MLQPIEKLAFQLFDQIRSQVQGLEMGDEDGGITNDPKDARFFDFPFSVNGNEIGHVSVTIQEPGTVKVFFGRDLSQTESDEAQKKWFGFLRSLRNFANRRLLKFDARDIAKNQLHRADYQHLSKSIKSRTMESAMYGSSKTSYRDLGTTRLIVRHKDRVGEKHGDRSRKISKIFIENHIGERFLYPYAHMAGARAMQMHINSGGLPWDHHGIRIVEMSEDLSNALILKKLFQKDKLNEEAEILLGVIPDFISRLREQVKNLSRSSIYNNWINSPIELTEDLESEQLSSLFPISEYGEKISGCYQVINKMRKQNKTLNLEAYLSKNLDKSPTASMKENYDDRYDSEAYRDHDHEAEAALTKFEHMCDAVGDDATNAQIGRLVDWAQKNIGKSYWDAAANIAAMSGVRGVYTDLRMHASESTNSDRSNPIKESISPEELEDWKFDALTRIQQGRVNSQDQLYGELVADLGVSDRAATMIASKVWALGNSEEGRKSAHGDTDVDSDALDSTNDHEDDELDPMYHPSLTKTKEPEMEMESVGKNYHSVFTHDKETGRWGHYADRDNREDAEDDRYSHRDQGVKTARLVVPKHEANWSKMTPDEIHNFVDGRQKKKTNVVHEAAKNDKAVLTEATNLEIAAIKKLSGL